MKGKKFGALGKSPQAKALNRVLKDEKRSSRLDNYRKGRGG